MLSSALLYTDTVYTHCAKCHRLEGEARSYLLSPSAGVRRLSSVTSLASSSVRVHVRSATITLLPNIVSWCCCVLCSEGTLHSTLYINTVARHGSCPAPATTIWLCYDCVYWDSGYTGHQARLYTPQPPTLSLSRQCTVHRSALSAESAAAVLTQ